MNRILTSVFLLSISFLSMAAYGNGQSAVERQCQKLNRSHHSKDMKDLIKSQLSRWESSREKLLSAGQKLKDGGAVEPKIDTLIALLSETAEELKGFWRLPIDQDKIKGYLTEDSVAPAAVHRRFKELMFVSDLEMYEYFQNRGCEFEAPAETNAAPSESVRSLPQ